MLSRLVVERAGPFRSLDLPLSCRLTVVTGDNGLGKSFLLDLLWYVQTWSWAGSPALPHPDARVDASIRPGQGRYLDSRILASFDDRRSYESGFHVDTQRWFPRMVAAGGPEGTARAEASAFPGDGIVVYAKVDGGFGVWDAYRNIGRIESTDGLPDERPRVFRLSREDVWDGLEVDGRVLCNGLIRDWVSWQQTKSPAFQRLKATLTRLSGDGVERLDIGEPRRVLVDDVRDVPTLDLSYGNVPLTHASAGMRRLASLAYLLVWVWTEHQLAATLRRSPPARSLVLLVDEVDAHLHPRWQRQIVPALLEVVRALSPELQVQLVVATHSPLVLASIEASFDAERDQLVHFSLEQNEPVMEPISFVKHGDVAGWLVSDTFGLEQARSIEAERAIEAAEAWMRGDTASLPEGLRNQKEIHAALAASLGELDHFWPRWIGGTHRRAAP